jgi:hypothetical protein
MKKKISLQIIITSQVLWKDTVGDYWIYSPLVGSNIRKLDIRRKFLMEINTTGRILS